MQHDAESPLRRAGEACRECALLFDEMLNTLLDRSRSRFDLLQMKATHRLLERPDDSATKLLQVFNEDHRRRVANGLAGPFRDACRRFENRITAWRDCTREAAATAPGTHTERANTLLRFALSIFPCLSDYEVSALEQRALGKPLDSQTEARLRQQVAELIVQLRAAAQDLLASTSPHISFSSQDETAEEPTGQPPSNIGSETTSATPATEDSQVSPPQVSTELDARVLSFENWTWTISVDGKAINIHDCKGMRFLHKLILADGRAVPAFIPEQGDDGQAHTSERLYDEDGLRSAETRMKEIEDQEGTENCRMNEEWVGLAEILAANGPGKGRQRKFRAQSKLHGDQRGAAFRTLLDKLRARGESQLADELKHCVRTPGGQNPRFEKREGTKWVVQGAVEPQRALAWRGRMEPSSSQ